jgi:hypothetical protein
MPSGGRPGSRLYQLHYPMHHSYRFRGVGNERHEDQGYSGYQEWTVCIRV